MKTIKAVFRGYIIFKVNGKKYFRYNSALKFRESIPDTKSVNFTGFNIFTGWKCFFLRIVF